MANVKVPKLPTIRRLPTYLYKLSEMRKAGVEIVATPELARYMNLGEIVIRKDLALTGRLRPAGSRLQGPGADRSDQELPELGQCVGGDSGRRRLPRQHHM